MGGKHGKNTVFNSDRHYIFIGDIHGYTERLKSLWRNLESKLGRENLDNACVVFLGDYCDRGPDTKGTLDFLIELKTNRKAGLTRFVAGNHDFAMACFLGCIPTDEKSFDLDSTVNEKNSYGGIWSIPVEGGMHIQGRRYGGLSIYDGDTTFASYGVNYEPGVDEPSDSVRRQFQKAVPSAHKKFLKDLEWVVDIDITSEDEESRASQGSGVDSKTPSFANRMIAVHAGLISTEPPQPQIEALKARLLSATVIQQGSGRIAPFSGRGEVGLLPKELLGTNTFVISGHHGYSHVTARPGEGGRVIVDESGGMPGKKYLQAYVLPAGTIVESDPLPN